jgi:hypothetical protein
LARSTEFRPISQDASYLFHSKAIPSSHSPAMNLPETNPYSPTSTPNLAAVSSPKWLRRFTILNLSLLAVPGIVLLVLYIVNASSNYWETDTASGDPVTYQHFVGIDVAPMAAALYFVVPNAILAVALSVWYNRTGSPDHN